MVTRPASAYQASFRVEESAKAKPLLWVCELLADVFDASAQLLVLAWLQQVFSA